MSFGSKGLSETDHPTRIGFGPNREVRGKVGAVRRTSEALFLVAVLGDSGGVHYDQSERLTQLLSGRDGLDAAMADAVHSVRRRRSSLAPKIPITDLEVQPMAKRSQMFAAQTSAGTPVCSARLEKGKLGMATSLPSIQQDRAEMANAATPDWDGR
jgi:hypothetical protein